MAHPSGVSTKHPEWIERVKRAEGGEVPNPTAEDMGRAKQYIRGLTQLGNGGDWRARVLTKSPNLAVENAANDTQELADSIRSNK